MTGNGFKDLESLKHCKSNIFFSPEGIHLELIKREKCKSAQTFLFLGLCSLQVGSFLNWPGSKPKER